MAFVESLSRSRPCPGTWRSTLRNPIAPARSLPFLRATSPLENSAASVAGLGSVNSGGCPNTGEAIQSAGYHFARYITLHSNVVKNVRFTYAQLLGCGQVRLRHLWPWFQPTRSSAPPREVHTRLQPGPCVQDMPKAVQKPGQPCETQSKAFGTCTVQMDFVLQNGYIPSLDMFFSAPNHNLEKH